METMTRKRKSEPLTREEQKALKQFRKKFNTDLDFAESVGVDRAVLHRAILVGSASPESVVKIRAALAAQD